MTETPLRPVGVILAAGVGSRLGPLGKKYVKALLPVANRPLIGHHLELLSDLGVQRVVIVVGHRAEFVEQAVGDGRRWGLELQLVEQSEPLGSAHALSVARAHIDGPFLLLLGDYYFVASKPETMLRRLERGQSAIAAKREPNERLIREACAIAVKGDGRVVSIVEKPAQPTTDLKGCGFYALQPEVFDAVMRTPRTALRNEYELTVTLELLLASGKPLYADEIIDWDSNVTRPEDLLSCNLEWLDRHGKSLLVADGAQVDSRTQLERAVVGEGATVRGESTLRDSVVFPGAELVSSGLVERTLVTGENPIHCAIKAQQLTKGERE